MHIGEALHQRAWPVGTALNKSDGQRQQHGLLSVQVADMLIADRPDVEAPF